MKRIHLIIIFSLILAFNANAKWYVTTQNVNVRTGAGTNYRLLGVITKGTKADVDVSYVSGSWLKVRYHNQIGFIYFKLLKETTPPANNTAQSERHPIAGLIGGIFGIIVVLGMIRLVLIEAWRTLTGRGYSSGGYRSTSGSSNSQHPDSASAKRQAQNRQDDYRKSHWGPNG
jgi:hypothetical protein